MEKTTSFTRRGFLKTAALAGGAAATSGMLSACSTIAPAEPATADANDEQVCTTYCNACMGCPLEAVVRNDNVVATRAKEIDSSADQSGADVSDLKRICARGASIPTMLVEDKRIKYPMRRVEGTERGTGQWERISWDDAISEICDKIKGYQSTYGKSSVCAFTYGTTEPRNLYNLYRLENLAEFSHQERVTDFGLAQGLMATTGTYFFQSCNDQGIMRGLKTLVIWGHNPCVAWPNSWHYIADAMENGCKLVVIDPNFNTIAQKADLFISVRPGTDAALAMGVVYYLEQNGLVKDDYLKQKSCAPFLVKQADGMFLRKSDLEPGIEKDSDADDFAVWDADAGALGFAKTTANPAIRMNGSFDAQGNMVNTAYDLLIDACSAYPLDTVAEITDVPASTVEQFAHLISENAPAEIFQGYGIDHYAHGFDAFMATSAVRIVCGMVQAPSFPFSLNDSGFTESEAGHPVTSAHIATFMFNDLIDKGEYDMPGFTMQMGGQTVDVPGTSVKVPLKMLISFGGNLVNSGADRNVAVEAYKKLDFHVAVNVEWCDTCNLADIVLPAAMIQESPGAISMDRCYVYGEQCITPRFEAKPDAEIARLIAEGIGLGDQFDPDMDSMLAHTMEGQLYSTMGLSFDALKQAKIIYMGAMPLPKYSTPTGRLQFYQETPMPFQYFGQVFNPAEHHLPKWEPPMEAWTVSAGGYDANPLAQKYPLQLIAGTRRFRVHSYYGQNPLLREMEVNEPCVRMNPADAQDRGISDGDYVRLFNDRGEAVALAQLSAGVRPGVLDIDRGWQGSQYKKGCSQNLTNNQIVDWSCPNTAYHDCLVQMEKWDGQ